MFKLISFFTLFIISTSLFADDSDKFIDSVSLTAGASIDSESIYKLGIQKNFNTKLYSNDFGYLSGFYDLSISYWDCKGNSVQALSLAPVFTYSFNSPIFNKTPYIYYGVGGAYISEKTTEQKDFSSHFQFENRIGLGLKSNKYEIDIGYFHYSNGGIKEPNEGMNIVAITYRHYI